MMQWLLGGESIRWVQQFFGIGHPLPFRVLSLFGDTWGILLVVGISFWLFGRRAAYPMVVMAAVGGATKLLLSDIFYQTRPDGPGIVVYQHLEIGSFPSGHVYETVASWGLLYGLGYVPIWIPALVVLLVGLGRIYLGTHYLADVIGGVFFGLILVWLFVKAWPRASGWLRDQRFALYAGTAMAVIAGTLVWAILAGGQPRRYEVYGMIIGAALALPLEHRFLRYHAGAASWSTRIAMVIIGTAGVAVFLLWDRSQPEDALFLGTITAGLATLWGVLGAPMLFTALGLNGGRAAREAADPATVSVAGTWETI